MKSDWSVTPVLEKTNCISDPQLHRKWKARGFLRAFSPDGDRLDRRPIGKGGSLMRGRMRKDLLFALGGPIWEGSNWPDVHFFLFIFSRDSMSPVLSGANTDQQLFSSL